MKNRNPMPQLPATGQVFLDHVGCFVSDIEEVAAGLDRLGIVMTPFTEQQNNGQPAGTANRCAMLERGYIEVLTPVRDTPLADQMRAALGRYEGLHLICFTTDDARETAGRLGTDGFDLQPPVNLKRETLDGPASFTVLRLQPPGMPEGRIQFCTHYTPDAVWPDRYLAEGNRARQLSGALLAMADPAEAAARFARFTGREAVKTANGHLLSLDRGALLFTTAAMAEKITGEAAPADPWIAATVLADETVESITMMKAGPLSLLCHPAGSLPDWLQP
jgi:hypothetical protein